MFSSRSVVRAAGLATACALLAIGCTEKAEAPTSSATPESASSTTATSIPTTEPPVTEPTATIGTDLTGTTEAPVETIAVETTVVEPTAVPPSGIPTGIPTEFFAGSDPDGWLPLGRWTGAAWEGPIGADGVVAAPAIGTDVAVLVHELDLAPIAGTTGAPAQACPDGRLGPSISPNPGSPAEPGFGYRSIAFAADWSTRPRPVADVAASPAAYVAAGVAAFEGTGVDASTGTVQQIVVVDLDGDGDAESLVAFGGPGFSALMLVDADSGASITVSRSVATVADVDAGTEAAENETYRTLTVADMNGDGLMEFAVHRWQAGGAAVDVDTYDGAAVTTVMSAFC